MILRILLEILADRVLLFVTLFLNFGLFAYAIYLPDPWRFALAVSFAVGVFWPVLKHTKTRGPVVTEEREAA